MKNNLNVYICITVGMLTTL